MTRLRRRISCVAVLVFTLTAFGLVSAADAQGSISGPVVTLDHTDVAPGDLIMVTLDGFEAPSVTISVCGNEARRASADCNMIESKGVRIDPAISPTVTKFGVSSPPATCPCVVRVSSQNNDEIAVTPINLVGHPVGPVVGGPSLDDPLVAVTISARPAPHGVFGWIRGNVGGPINYDVTVTVKNITTEPLRQVSLTGSVGRSAEGEIATLALDDPGEIGPGQSWTQVVSAEVPAPSFSSVEWRVAASRAGPRVTATSTTQHRPVLLLLLAMVLVVDLALIAIRYRMRRRAAREAANAAGASEDEAAADTDESSREPVMAAT